MVLTADVTLKTTNDWFDIVMDEETGFGQQLGLLSSFESSKFEEPTFQKFRKPKRANQNQAT